MLDVRKSLRNELNKKNLITVAGAVIVFVTFIVNDLLVEKYRELSNSLDQAGVAYLSRNASKNTDVLVLKVMSLLENKLGKFDSKEPVATITLQGPETNGAITTETLTADSTAYDVLRSDLIAFDNSDRLWQKLSDDPNDKAQIILLRKIFEDEAKKKEAIFRTVTVIADSKAGKVSQDKVLQEVANVGTL